MSAATAYRRMFSAATSHYVGPPPQLAYAINDVILSGTTVIGWRNSGSLGSAYDLVVPSGKNPPVFLPQGGKHYRGAVQFSPGQGLETLNQLPANLFGTASRVFMARITFPYGSGATGGSGVNVFGAGVPGSGTLADCATIGAGAIYTHEYFAQSEQTPAIGLPRFAWVGYVFSAPNPAYSNANIGSATPTMSQWAISTSGESTRTNEAYLTTGQSGFRLGCGYYAPFDLAQGGLTLEVDYAVVLAGQFTDSQIYSIMF